MTAEKYIARGGRCDECAGEGYETVEMQFLADVRLVCPTCRGRGKVVKDKCIECKGGGVERKKESVLVNVPAGIDDGQTLRLARDAQRMLDGWRRFATLLDVSSHQRLL